jgi:CRISPR-associated exonuclease Cas4
MEQNNEHVNIGKIIEKESYKRRSSKNKQIILDNIKVDYIDFKNKILYETKKSSKYKDSAIWQMKYYLYIIRDNYTGVIEIPKEREKINVSLTEDDISHLEFIINDISSISEGLCPAVIKEKKCKNCSFNEFCYS